MGAKNLYEVLDNSISEGANFFASVMTEFHLTSVLVYAESLLKKGAKINGYICIAEHPTSGYLLEEKFLEKYNLHLVRSYKSIMLPRINKIGRIFFYHILNKEKSDNFYLVNVSNPRCDLILKCLLNKSFENKLIVACVDEAIGSYMPAKYIRNIAKFESKNYRKTNIFKKLICKFILLPLTIEKFSFFKADSNGKLRGNNIINDYKIFYEQQYLNIFPISSDVKEYVSIINNERRSSLAIYFSQPLVEYGLLDAGQQKNILKELESNLSQRRVQLLIKPHPRENYEFFKILGIDVIEFNLPAEMVALLLKPTFIIGVNTTALATISTIFNIPAYSIMDVIEKEFNTSSFLIQSMDIYKSKLDNIINFIDDFDKFPIN